MAIEQLADDLHIIPGLVNVYLLRAQDGYALLDSGFPGNGPRVLEGVRSLGLAPSDVKNILLTHAHPDHIGSAAELKRQTGATVWAHPADAPLIESGGPFRYASASPGLRNKLLAMVLRRVVTRVDPTPVDHHLVGGERLPFLPDLEAIHVPGHCAGQLAFLWSRRGGVLFPADTCVNLPTIRLPVATEDLDLALASLATLSGLKFETVCFMHGKPIMAGGDAAFRKIWLDRTSPRSLAA